MNYINKTNTLVPIEMLSLNEGSELNLCHFPQNLREVIEELHKEIQAPTEMIVYLLLSSIAFSSQHLFNVESHRDPAHTHPISLIAIVLGRSGERKSSVQKRILTQITNYIKKNISASNGVLGQYARKVKKITSELDDIEDGFVLTEGSSEECEKARELKRRLFELRKTRPECVDGLFRDGSIQGLWETLENKRSSVGWFNDEASNIFGGYVAGSEQRTNTATQLTTLYDGSEVRINYKSNKKTLIDKRLSVCFSAQPEVMKEHLKDKYMSDQGLFPRALFTNPPSMIGNRSTSRSDISTPKTEQFSTDLLSMFLFDNRELRDDDEVGTGLGLHFENIGWTNEAKELAYDYEERLEPSFGEDGLFFNDSAFGLRILENATRVAALFSIYESLVEMNSISRSQHISEDLNLTRYVGKITKQHFQAGYDVAYYSFKQWVDLRNETADVDLLNDCNKVYGKLVKYIESAKANTPAKQEANGHFSKNELIRLSVYRGLKGARASRDPNSIQSRKAIEYLLEKILPELTRLDRMNIGPLPNCIGNYYSVIHKEQI